MPLQLILVVALALIFDFLNGVHGSSNIVATVVTSRAFRPPVALAIIGAAEFTGPFLFGVAVAKTVGAQIVNTKVITYDILMAALISCVAWNFVTWLLGLPSSPSHGLVGGLIGATLLGAGFSALRIQGLTKVLFALFITPLVSFGFGFLVTRLIFYLARSTSPRINDFFKRSQLVTAVFLALSQGSNDAQKAMGIIVLSLIIDKNMFAFNVPLWVMALSAAGMALGTVFSGARLIRTLGGKFYKIRPVHSFAAQCSSLFLMIASSFLGLPVSTTQLISSSIIGVGSAERLGKIRWSVANDILVSWILTIPCTAALAAGLYWLLLRTAL
ncbi:MAG TPA: inorganic phosphate transporter [Anaerolineales bacterium]|nr:inorganic phosphate transporter [Anaerolineales bacterium]